MARFVFQLYQIDFGVGETHQDHRLVAIQQPDRQGREPGDFSALERFLYWKQQTREFRVDPRDVRQRDTNQESLSVKCEG